MVFRRRNKIRPVDGGARTADSVRRFERHRKMALRGSQTNDRRGNRHGRRRGVLRRTEWEPDCLRRCFRKGSAALSGSWPCRRRRCELRGARPAEHRGRIRLCRYLQQHCFGYRRRKYYGDGFPSRYKVMTTVRSDIAPETTAIPGLGQLNVEDLAGQTVVMRIDAAVPANAHEALRDVKLKTALASLDLLLSSKARVALLCHTDAGLHNIEAQRDTCQRLAFLLGKPIQVLDECRGPEVTETAARLRHGEVRMLGNLSLESEEEANSPRLARYLADLGDLYCNEAFSLAHEVRTSTLGAVKMAQRPVAGLDCERTLNLLRNTLDHPQRPFLTVIGGELSIANLLLLR